MLPNISKLRLDGGGAARKPAPTDDNLVPLSVLDEPMTFAKLGEWGNMTARKAHDWFKAQGRDQNECMYTTDSLAQGCDPEDTETWNRLFWVATNPQITIPYAAQISNSVPPVPDWAAASVALPIPKPWLEDGPQAIIQVTPSTTKGVPGVHFVHKATLLKMFAIQRQKEPDGVNGLPYPDAYKGPGYGKPDFFIPQPNGYNGRARLEMRAILDAFLEECNRYRTKIENIGTNGFFWSLPVKLYEMGCDFDRNKFDFEDASGEFRQTNPFPTPWRYGTGTNALHYVDYTYHPMPGDFLGTKKIFTYEVTEAPRPATPPRRRNLPDSITRASRAQGRDDDPAFFDFLLASDEDEEEEREEERDEEEEEESGEDTDSDMEDSVPGPMTRAINDANALDEASQTMVSLPAEPLDDQHEELMLIVDWITFRMQNLDSEYVETLSDPDQALPALLRGLTRMWEGFHLLPRIDAIKVFDLLDKAQAELGEIIKFDVRQLVTSDVPRLEWWMQSNLQGAWEDDTSMIPAGSLLVLAQGNDDLNIPRVDLQAFEDAVAKMESLPRGSAEWSTSYRKVTTAMRRIAYLANISDDYLKSVALMLPWGLAETILRLENNLLWDEFDDDWDIRHVREYMQLPLIRFLDTMTDLAKDMRRGFMTTLRNRKRQITISLDTFWRGYDSDEPELARMIQRVVERLEATPPPPPLASQQRQASVPAVQGAEALREIANSPSPEREEAEEQEEVMDQGTLSPAPTPNPAPVLRRNSSDGYQTRRRTRQRRESGTGATLRRTGLLLRFF